jgi:hypothetical protein
MLLFIFKSHGKIKNMLNIKMKANRKNILKLIVPVIIFFTMGNFVMAAEESMHKPIKLPNLEVTYENPLKVNSFTQLVRGFLTQVQAIVGWLAVIMIVVGGIVYMTATGRSKQIELGKTILTYALLGFVIAVAAPSILKEIFDLASSGKGTASSNVIKESKDIKDIVGSVMTFVIALVGVISAIAFVITGFQFIAAGGDGGRADKARKGLTYAIIGVTVSGAALIVVKQLLVLMGIG